MRSQSIKALLAQLGPNADAQKAESLIAGQLGKSTQSDLLNQAVAKAQSDLALGGALPLDVRNLVARNAAATGGSVGNIRLGKDISARDLGLTSLQLQAQRLAQAQALGQADLASKQFDSNYLLNQGSLLQSMSSGDFARALAAAQFGQSLQTPVVGLDPSAIANLSVGNANAGTAAGLQAAQIGASQAQGAGSIGSSLLGSGLGGLAKYFGSSSSTPTIAVPAASSVPYYGYGFN